MEGGEDSSVTWKEEAKRDRDQAEDQVQKEGTEVILKITLGFVKQIFRLL